MIKNFAKRKVVVTTFAFVIFFITLIFPSKTGEYISTSTSYIDGKIKPIFLLNADKYVSRVQIVTKETNLISQVQELLNYLIIDNDNINYIPNSFSPVIPKETKVLSLDIQDKLVKINFSKEFLNIPIDYGEKMIQCIVYTLTELDGIEGVLILVDGNILDKFPNSNKTLPHILNRNIGVNTIYNFNQMKDVKKTTTYFLAKNNNLTYYVPVTLLENNNKQKIDIVIERLKSNPHLQTNLISYLNASLELSNYELLEEEIRLSFNDTLYEGISSDEIKEQVEYSIVLSIKDTMNVKNVILTKENN